MRAFIALSLGLMLAGPFVSACQRTAGSKPVPVGPPAASPAGQSAEHPPAASPSAPGEQPAGPFAETSRPDGGVAWPCFRGGNPGGPALNGGDPPVKIDPEKNALYKVNVPAPGQSSPIIWGNRVYLTGDDDHIMAFDRATGKLAWDRTLKAPPAMSQPAGPDGGPPADEPEISPDAGTAAPTPATDGNCVYACFGSGVIGCVDRNGKQVWARRLTPGLPRNTYGLASSPLVYGDTVIQQVDLGRSSADGLSFLIALATRDGAEKWRKQRPTGSSWSSPVLAKLPEGDSVITCGAPAVIAYDARTGAKLWQCDGPVREVAASPIFCGGVVIAPSSYSGGSVTAVKPGGKGDVTKTHVAWETEMPAPNFASFVSDGKTCFYISGCDLLAMNPANGKQVWKVELDGDFYACPVVAAGRIYAVNRGGTLFVVSTGGTKLQENKLNTDVDASPAIVDGRIYIRTKTELWCLGNPAAAPAK